MTAPLDAEARSMASHVLLVRGIVVGLLGVVAVFWPEVTVKVSVRLIGLIVLVFGASMIAHALDRRRADLAWIGSLIGGGVVLVGGATALFWPGPTALVVARIVGALLIVSGLLTVLDVFVGANDPARIPMAVLGGLSVACGLALLVWPEITIGAVVILQGLFWILGGILSIVASRQVADAAPV